MDAQRFRFGLFSFDVSSGELKREGVPVRLQAQPARVLAHLIRRAAEVVPREEMRETIWGEETFVNFERGLNVCIASIRTALGDDANAPRYIRTVHRQGYQFIAPVECVSDSVGPQISRPVGSPSFPWRTIAVAAGFLLAIALAAAFALHRRHAPQSPQEPSIVAVARFDNETGDPAINQFSEGLTDNVVVELTRMSGDKFRVIGNATILREPREHRNLVPCITHNFG